MAWIKHHGVGPRHHRDVELIGFSAFLGPPIGALLFGVINAIQLERGPEPLFVVILAGLAFGALLILFSHMLGLVPALLSGAAMSVAARYVARPSLRIALAFPIGAAASALWIVPFVRMTSRSAPPVIETAASMAPAILAGALTAVLLQAMIERFGSPLPAPQSPSNSAVDR